jgi:hypothetical protein
MNPGRVVLQNGCDRGMERETCRELATPAGAQRGGGYFCKPELADW